MRTRKAAELRKYVYSLITGITTSTAGAEHPPDQFAKSNTRGARPLAPAAHDHFVAVFQKAPRLAVGQAQRSLAAARQFQHRTGFLGLRTGLRAGTEQVSGPQVAAVDRVVCQHLCNVPVRV